MNQNNSKAKMLETNLDILTIDQLKEFSDVLKTFPCAKLTDFALQLQRDNSGNKFNYKYSKSVLGKYYIKDDCGKVNCVVFEDGRYDFIDPEFYEKDIGVRLCFNFDKNNVYGTFNNVGYYRNGNGLLVGKLGFYPQSLLSLKEFIFFVCTSIFDNYQYTGRDYGIFKYISSKVLNFTPIISDGEYEKFLSVLREYIRNGNVNAKYVKLFNRIFKVEPIWWILDRENGMAISEKILVSGILSIDVDEYVRDVLSKDIQILGITKLKKKKY